jgi:hypothetical protein
MFGSTHNFDDDMAVCLNRLIHAHCVYVVQPAVVEGTLVLVGKSLRYLRDQLKLLLREKGPLVPGSESGLNSPDW